MCLCKCVLFVRLSVFWPTKNSLQLLHNTFGNYTTHAEQLTRKKRQWKIVTKVPAFPEQLHSNGITHSLTHTYTTCVSITVTFMASIDYTASAQLPQCLPANNIANFCQTRQIPLVFTQHHRQRQQRHQQHQFQLHQQHTHTTILSLHKTETLWRHSNISWLLWWSCYCCCRCCFSVWSIVFVWMEGRSAVWALWLWLCDFVWLIVDMLRWFCSCVLAPHQQTKTIEERAPCILAIANNNGK